MRREFVKRDHDRACTTGELESQRGAPLSDTPAIPGNQTYYFQVGAGVWRGTFLFRVTSWQRLRASGIGVKQMSLAVAMTVFTRITGKATIDSEIWAHPEERAFGTASNHVRIHRLGLTLYLLDEVYTLDPDGRSVAVDARERFGPIPFLFRNHKQHPAEINSDGLGSTYYFPPSRLPAAHRRPPDVRLGRGVGIDGQAGGRVTATPELDPAARLGAIAAELDRLTTRLEQARDSRCVFTYAYSIMTRRIAVDLSGQPAGDADWIALLADAFSKRYFAAIEAYDRGELAEGAWRTVFDALRNRRTSALEDLVFAMTGHIVHDLPLALGDVGPEPGRIADFQYVNELMKGTIEVVEREVARRYSPVLRWVDRLAEGYDQILTDYGIRMSRGLAWYNALRLADPRAREGALAAIEHSPELVVSNVLDPPKISLRIVFRFLRLIVRLGRRWPRDDRRRCSSSRARTARRSLTPRPGGFAGRSPRRGRRLRPEHGRIRGCCWSATCRP